MASATVRQVFGPGRSTAKFFVEINGPSATSNPGIARMCNDLGDLRLVAKGLVDVPGDLRIGGVLDFSGELRQNGAPYIASQWTTVDGAVTCASNVIVGKTASAGGYALDVSGAAKVGSLHASNIYVTGSILPTANVAYDLGSSDMRFRDLFLSGSTINIGDAAISLDSSGKLDFGSNVFAVNMLAVNANYTNVTATNVTATNATLAHISATEATAGTLTISGTLNASLDSTAIRIGTSIAELVDIGTNPNCQLINIGTGAGLQLLNIGTGADATSTIITIGAPGNIVNLHNPSGSGALLSNLDASKITTGTLSSSLLSSNVTVAGNLHIGGALYKNGVPYIVDVGPGGGGTSSQWTTLPGAAGLSYASNVAAASFTDLSGAPVVFSNALIQWRPGTTQFRQEGEGGAALSVGAGGALDCRVVWLGSMVTVDLRMTLGAGASLGDASRAWAWTLPVALAPGRGDRQVGTALMRQAGGGNFSGAVYVTSEGLAVVYRDLVAWAVTTDTPFAWAAGDSLSMSFTYEAATFDVSVPLSSALQQTASGSVGLGATPDAALPPHSLVAASFVGAGSNLWALNASSLASGTLANARLPAVVSVAGALGVGFGAGGAAPTKALDVSGDVNFTGALFRGGAPYVGSQWTTTASNIAYGSNVDVSGALNVRGDLAFSGRLMQAGAPYVGSQWTTTASNIAYGGEVQAARFVDASGSRMLSDALVMWSPFAGVAAWLDDGTALAFGADPASALTARTFAFGATVMVEIRATLASGAALGDPDVGGGWTWSLPQPPADACVGAVIGQALMRQAGASAGASAYTGVVVCTAAGRAKVLLDGGDGRGASAEAPFAWAAGDGLSLLISYEAAGAPLPSYMLPAAFLQSATGGSLGLGLAPASGGSGLPAGSLVLAGAMGVGGVASPSSALDVSGSVTVRAGGGFVGSGASLTGLNASALASGTLDAARLPATIVAASFAGAGSDLTSLNASALATGTLSAARLPAVVAAGSFAGVGSNLTSLNASALASGTLDPARLPAVVAAGSFAGVGSNLTSLNASALATGTLDAARLPATATFAGAVSVQGQFVGSNVRILGNLELFGSNVLVFSQEIVSSNVVITNAGTGPALYVEQRGAQDVANFVDDGVSALRVWDGGSVSVGGGAKSAYALDVSGALRATGLAGACITDLTNVVSSAVAASATAVKGAYDLANTALSAAGAALSAAGGAVTGALVVGRSGAPTAGYVLDVSGAARVSGLAWFGSNVGIGKPTGSLAYALDVSGSVNVSGTVTTTNRPYIYGGFVSGTGNVTLTSLSASGGMIITSSTKLYPTVAGLYMIGFNTLFSDSATTQNPTTGRWDFLILKNMSTIVYTLNESNGSGFHYRSGSIVLPLLITDYIQFNIPSGYAYGADGSTYYMCLI